MTAPGIKAAAVSLLHRHVHGSAKSDGCPTCDAALNSADSSIQGAFAAIHAMCPAGRAIARQTMPARTRDFTGRVEAALGGRGMVAA